MAAGDGNRADEILGMLANREGYAFRPKPPAVEAIHPPDTTPRFRRSGSGLPS